MTVSPGEAAFAYIGAFVEELSRSGVRHVCIAPGSRSAPLAMTFAAHPRIRTWVHLDERVAAFFALGMARATGRPVALVCTSGTAGAHFHPAVIEARRSGVPLLVLTADRPPELRDVGAAQTIDQNRLYGDHAKWFVEAALPEATPEMLRYARTLACRAAAAASATPPGPVHLNFPFREPLVPVPVTPPPGMPPGDALAWSGRPDAKPWVTIADAPPSIGSPVVERLARLLRTAARPLVVCGPQFDAGLAEPLMRLAAGIGAPVLADPLSQQRWGSDESVVIDRYDAALRHEPTAAGLVPDLILRIGGLPTSKVLLHYLMRHAHAEHVVVHPAGWPDPTLLAVQLVHAEPRSCCEMLISTLWDDDAPEPRDRRWMQAWQRIEAVTDAALGGYVASIDERFEGRVLAEIAALVPDGGTLFVSSSMPVRDLDAFAPGDRRAIRVLANRGANGIDGVVSTALGAVAAAADDATGRGGPLVLAIGDIALYHDMNGLLAGKLHGLDATIVVINNDGGGIFSFLPQAAHREHFELLFGTPHGLDFAPVAQLYGASYRLAETWESLRDGIREGTAGQGLHIIEIRTDRERNVVLHHDAWRAVASALDAHAVRGE